MKLIYRIENKRGRGMYYNGDEGCQVRYMMQEERHPPPTSDVKLRGVWEKLYWNGEHQFWQFGFNSLDQLRSWVYKQEWRWELHDAGFAVYAYAATDYHLGDTQAIMIKPALPVGHMILTCISATVADEWFQSLEEEYNASERKIVDQASDTSRKYWQDYLDATAEAQSAPVSVGA